MCCSVFYPPVLLFPTLFILALYTNSHECDLLDMSPSIPIESNRLRYSLFPTTWRRGYHNSRILMTYERLMISMTS
jgi:hypothetical protein